MPSLSGRSVFAEQTFNTVVRRRRICAVPQGRDLGVFLQVMLRYAGWAGIDGLDEVPR
ncbi:MAG: hypothetical protein ABWY12_06035 [Burkholderiales bacterium]